MRQIFVEEFCLKMGGEALAQGGGAYVWDSTVHLTLKYSTLRGWVSKTSQNKVQGVMSQMCEYRPLSVNGQPLPMMRSQTPPITTPTCFKELTQYIIIL